jgi:hypothetical protein
VGNGSYLTAYTNSYIYNIKAKQVKMLLSIALRINYKREKSELMESI